MSVIGNPLLLTPEGYQISRSVRLRSSASAYFNRTPASAGNRKTWTWSGWVKRGALANQDLFNAYQDANNQTLISFSSDTLIVYTIHGGGSFDYGFQTTAVFRDPSAWYHVVAVFDSANATAANRAAVYVNGVKQTGSMAFGDIPLNQDGIVNSTNAHSIGRRGSGSLYFDGYLTEVNFIDGQALTPSSFGETDAVTGVWKPKKYTGTYGTNGFYLNFSDPSAATAAAIGKDYSGNGNNWTPNNISVTAGATYDSMIDVPTPYADGGNGRGNYAVLNPLNFNRPTILDGNIRVAGGDRFALSTIGMTSGQWYAEMTVITVGSETSCGIAKTDNSSAGSNYVGSTSDSYGYYAGNGNKYNNASSSAYGATYTSGDVIGIAFDADAGTLVFYKNNTTQGTAFTGLTSGPYYFAVEGRSSGTANNVAINFGQRPFAYTPPTGFKALNTQNLPEPTIVDGSQYFDVSLWTGDQAARTITNSGSFQPDLIWTKSRSDAESHRLHDSVRGGNGSVLYELNSNLTEAEGTDTLVSGFATNGFTIASGANTPNITGRTYVGWQWKAGGTPAVTNTAGSITSTVSAGVTQGFSVVTYTGTGANATVGHGLGVAPRMIIVKRRNSTGEWLTYTQMTGNTNFLELNTTAASFASSTAWNNTSPTSSVFSVGTASGCNASGGTYVAYCFAEVPGFSKFGSYTGNGSTDGPFVFCGFRPAFVMIKASSAAGYNWTIEDSARSTFNASDKLLYPSTSSAENSGAARNDFLSNGFKARDSSNNNVSGVTYIYAAFAEHPFKNALAR